MKTVVLKLAYDGAGYKGFAKQKEPDVATVQNNLEDALATLFRRPVATVCAGRTDTGVHALSQFISFELEDEELAKTNRHKMLVSMNALTPQDISVKDVFVATGEFSARFDAIEREYRYRIVRGPVPPLFLRNYAWWLKGRLDVEAMREASRLLIGEHDFKSFCKAESAIDKTTMRCVNDIQLWEEEHLGEKCLVIQVRGNAFLHSMVRTIVGTLVEVGANRRPVEWVAQVLEAKNRTAAGQNAPACGLTFWNVTYPEGSLIPLD